VGNGYCSNLASSGEPHPLLHMTTLTAARKSPGSYHRGIITVTFPGRPKLRHDTRSRNKTGNRWSGADYHRGNSCIDAGLPFNQRGRSGRCHDASSGGGFVLTQVWQAATPSLTAPAGGSVRPSTLAGRVETALDFPPPARPEADTRALIQCVQYTGPATQISSLLRRYLPYMRCAVAVGCS